MTWVAVGTTAVGAAGAYLNSRNQQTSAPPPQALPGAVNMGGVMTDYGGLYRDPTTGLVTQQDYRFDPYGISSNLDARAMWNQFMGRGNENQVSDLDWQIKQLQQRYDQMNAPGQGAQSQLDLKKYFGAYAPFITVDDKGNPSLDKSITPDNANSIPRDSELFQRFMKDTGGNYGSSNRDISFGKWLKDDINRTLNKQMDTFRSDYGSMQGNQQVNTRGLQDIKNQIDYLTQQRGRMASPQTGPGSNPLMDYTTNLGPEWAGNMQNRNPWTDQWNTVVQDRLRQQGQSPNDWMAQYGVDTASMTPGTAQFNAAVQGLSGSPQMIGAAPRAPGLDLGAANAQRQALDMRTAMDFANQQKLAEQTAARRGMLNSSVGEMTGAANRANLINQQLQNQLNATKYGNDLIAQQYGMQGQEFGMNAQAAQANNAAELARRGLQLQYMNTGLNRQFDQGMQRAGLAGNLQNQWFQQAMAALSNANAMRAEDRNMNVQDYQLQQQRNQMGYGRASDMWTRLQNQMAQANQQRLGQSGMALQGINSLAPISTQYANWGNQSNLANTQMQNAWQMQNQQNAQAQRNANTNLWGNLAAAGLNAWGQNYGSQPQLGETYTSYNPATSYGQISGLPSSGGVAPNLPDNWWLGPQTTGQR